MVKLGRTISLSLLVLLLFLHGPRATYAETAASPADVQKFLSWVDFYQNRSKSQYALTGANRIDEASYVAIGGVEQWVTIRGEDKANPVLLVLHGGPGDVTNPWGYAYFSEWEKYFTVVQWDQRGAGRTLEKASTEPLSTAECCSLTAAGEALAATITIDRLVQDGIELSAFLRQHLDKPKIILVGHSWGSVLGGLMAKERPELFYALVGTGQVPADSKDNNIVAYRVTSRWAQSTKNAQAAAELKRIGPPPYKGGSDGWGVLYKWRNACEGPGRDRFLASTLYLALSEPGYSFRDYNFSQEGQLISGQALFEATSKLDPQRLEGEFQLPVFVFQGDQDCTTPTELAKRWLDSVAAPRKHFALLRGEGHFAAFIKSDEFLKDLVHEVRPLTVGKVD